MCFHIYLGIRPWYSPGQTILTLLFGEANMSWENAVMCVKTIGFLSCPDCHKERSNIIQILKKSFMSSDLLFFTSSAVTTWLLRSCTCWVIKMILVVTVDTRRCKIIPRYLQWVLTASQHSAQGCWSCADPKFSSKVSSIQFTPEEPAKSCQADWAGHGFVPFPGQSCLGHFWTVLHHS